MSELSDLPVIDTRYPGLGVTYDLSPLLTNGVRAFGEGSIMATLEANHVFWDCRLAHTAETDSDNRRFFEGIPEELTPPASTARAGILGSGIVQVQWTASWRFMQIFGRRLTEGALSFEGRTLRRPA